MPKSMENLALGAIEGKCFQHKLNPCNIVEVLKTNIPNFSLIDGSDNTLSVWSPIEKEYLHISLREFDHYNEVSKDYFNKIKTMCKKGLQDQVKKEYDERIIQNMHKPNLSEQETENKGGEFPWGDSFF